MSEQELTELRDRIAIAAMASFITGHVSHYGHDNHWPFDQLANEAYIVADAMLKERAK